MNGRQREDLDWLAFRYVTAELSPGESREFERRLEQDQQAREAVGRVVELTCAVRSLDWDAVPRAAPVRRQRPWHRRRGVQLAAGLALGLAFALSIWRPPHGEQEGQRNGSFAGILPPAELALVWSHARTELNSLADEDATGWQWLASANRDPDPSMSVDQQAEIEHTAVDTPEWMVSAVVAMESEGEEQEAPDSNIEGI